MALGRRLIVAAAAALSVGLAGAAQAQDSGLLHAMFQDHGVLQRDRPVPVWGRAKAGETVSVELAGQRATATADANGRWQAMLPPLPAGGPYVLSAKASGGEAQSVSDVLVGDVWLCSGQSNMELQVKYATNAFNEISSANSPTIRLFQVDKTAGPAPMTDFDPTKKAPRWEAVSPANIADFSAACYYFARELQKTVKVPQGLIHSSWGGSTIQAWLDEPELRQLGYGPSADILKQYRTDPQGAGRAWGKAFEAWWTKNEPTRGRPWTEDGEAWTPAPASLGAWETWNVPELASFDGLVWLRTTVNLTAAQAKAPVTLSLGQIADADITWINGQPVGSDKMWGPERSYSVPKGVLKAGRNVITIGVFNAWSNGGLLSDRSKLALKAGRTAVPLDQVWSYRVGTSGNSAAPFPPWDTLFGVSGLRNGMLAPLGPYGYRGVVWYQGESNAARGKEYGPMLKALITEFRKGQTGDVTFLDVQLAEFGPRATKPVESGWMDVREAQRTVVAADPKAGLAVAADIGDPYDVHPAEKPELGRRLARAARRVSYGEAIAPSGPIPTGASLQGGEVVVPFTGITGKLISYSSDHVIGFEVCDAAKACAFADARIEGTSVRLTPPQGKTPAFVRYAWADSPVMNLYDDSGLPAGPFEIPVR